METKQNPFLKYLKTKTRKETNVEISKIVPELSPEDNAKLIEQLRQNIEQLRTQNSELEGKLKNLEAKHFATQASTKEDMHDSSALQTNKNWQLEIIKTIPDLIWLKDAQGIYLECNPMFERFFGAKQADIIGKTDYDFVEKELGDFFRKHDQLAMMSGTPTINEEWITFSDDGRKVFLETIKTPMYNSLGEIVGVLGIGRDITKRHQTEVELSLSENKFKAVFENSIIGKSMTTLDGKLYTNKSFANMLGYDFKEFNSVSWKDITVPEDIAYNEQLIEQIISGKRESARWEKRYIHKDGSIVWGDLSTTLQKNNDGEPLFFITEIVDITDRKKAEKEANTTLQEAKLLKKALDTVGSSVYMKDMHGAYTFANQKTLELFESTGQSIIGKDDSAFFSTEVTSKIKAVDTKVLSGKNSASEIQLQSKTGEFKNYWEIKNPLYDNENKIIGLIGISTDITIQKTKENELKNANDHLNLIIENNPIAIWDWDILEDKWFVTPQYYSLLGYEPESGFPKRETWLNRLHPEDRMLVESKIADVLINKHENYAYDARLLHANGSYRWQSVIGNVVDRTAEGIPKRMMGVRIDINERKLIEEKLKTSEEELSALFSSMTEMVVIHELVFNELNEPIDYRIVDCNNAFVSLIGMTKDEIIGRLGTDIYNSEAAPYMNEYLQVTTTGKPLDFDSYFAPMDKHFLISAISYAQNKFTTISTDISNLQIVQKLLSEKNKELEDYLYVTSHDLRSPLVNIQGFSQRLKKQTSTILGLLSEKDANESAKTEIEKIGLTDIPRTLDFIYSNVEKMEMLINGILQISRTGRVMMSVKKIDMNNLFKTITTALNFQLTELKATVIIDELTDCYGDENQLNQLFTNLLTNSIKYHNNTRNLQIRISSKESYSKVIYSITDNGIGIAPKYHDKIWTVFYRVNPQGPVIGDGIGLSLVKRITDKHLGKVFVESEENVGSTFSVELSKHDF